MRRKSDALTERIAELRKKNEEVLHKLKTRKESNENISVRKKISHEYTRDRGVVGNKAIDSKSKQLQRSVEEKQSAESSNTEAKELHSRLTTLLKQVRELRAAVKEPEESVSSDNGAHVSFVVVSAEKTQELRVAKKNDRAQEEISPEPEIKFTWDHGDNLSTNLERLLNDYLEGTGHSLGRVMSAKRVLAKIEQLKKSPASDEEKQRELISFVRKQGIHTFGLNRKKSQLHAIYCTAELAYQYRVNEKKRSVRVKYNESKSDYYRQMQFIERKTKEKSVLERTKAFYQFEMERVQKDKRILDERSLSKQDSVDLLRKDIQEKTQVIEQLRNTGVELGMKYHSVHVNQITKPETMFVQDQKARVETLSTLDQKIEENRKTTNDVDIETTLLQKGNSELESEVQAEFKQLAQERRMTMREVDIPLDTIEARVRLWATYSPEPSPKSVVASPSDSAKAPGADNIQEEHEESNKDQGPQIKPQ